jgi:hypothetical protein
MSVQTSTAGAGQPPERVDPGTGRTAIRPFTVSWENNADNFNAVHVGIPAAVTVFPGEIYRAPRSWAERACHNLIYFNEVDKWGRPAA